MRRAFPGVSLAKPPETMTVPELEALIEIERMQHEDRMRKIFQASKAPQVQQIIGEEQAGLRQIQEKISRLQTEAAYLEAIKPPTPPIEVKFN